MNGLHPVWNCLAWGAVMALPACAPSPPSPHLPASAAGGAAEAPAPGGICDARPAQGAVGQAATPALAESARQQAGARTVRIIGHDDIVTKEYDTTRLNLQLDARGRVVRVYCG